jgi:hypothetical protein
MDERAHAMRTTIKVSRCPPRVVCGSTRFFVRPQDRLYSISSADSVLPTRVLWFRCAILTQRLSYAFFERIQNHMDRSRLSGKPSHAVGFGTHVFLNLLHFRVFRVFRGSSAGH